MSLAISFSVCRSADADEMVHLLADAFSHYDPPALATGITVPEFESFVRLLAPRAQADGLTIVARAVETGEMIGALVTEDSASPLPDGIDRLSARFDPIFDILGQLDADYRGGTPAAPGESLHLLLLGVARAFSGHRIAQQLVAACVDNGARRGYRVAVTEATSAVSQHVFRKQGFVDRVQRSYQDHRFNGRAYFDAIVGHTGPILMDKALGHGEASGSGAIGPRKV